MAATVPNVDLPDLTKKPHESELTPIQEFYTDAKIFITGCTGFLGNILIEKLLRSCPNISTIYLLIRSKKGKDIQTRLNELFDDVVFERLRNESPNFREKLYGIEGDCLLPGLGLCPQDVRMLKDEVNIIFHVAATVRFDEKLKTAIAINVRATKDLLGLAHQMPKLESFVHVSTLYSNCTNKVIEEKIYPIALDYNCLIKMAECLPENILDKMTPMLIDKYPNTYTYTKQIAEGIFDKEAKGLPVGISRPSIVVSTYKEPITGWINNMYGATGIVAGCYAGVIRTLYCNQKYNANLVPVDMCVNFIIATGWEVANTFKEAQKNNDDYRIPIYNYESINDQPLTWEKFMTMLARVAINIPLIKVLWYYSFRMITSYWIFMFTLIFLHFIPALIVDAVCLCMGKSPRMTKLYMKVNRFSSAISYFITNDWTIKSENVQKLINKMSVEDRKMFFSNLKELDWFEFIKTYAVGIRIYLIKDPMDTVPEARKKFRRLFWLHQTTKAVTAILFLLLLWYLFSFV